MRRRTARNIDAGSSTPFDNPVTLVTQRVVPRPLICSTILIEQEGTMNMQTATVRIVVAAVFAATVGASIPTIGNTPTVGWTSTNIVAPVSYIDGLFRQGS
jgi:hypothetical protein